MALVLDLPRDVDERLGRDAERRGVAKESLAIDIISRCVRASGAAADGAAGFWSPVSFESLVREQGAEPVDDFERWLASLPAVNGADELVKRIEESRRERRQVDRARQ